MENPYSKQDQSEKVTQLHLCLSTIETEIYNKEYQLRLLNRQKECLEYYLQQEQDVLRHIQAKEA